MTQPSGMPLFWHRQIGSLESGPQRPGREIHLSILIHLNGGWPVEQWVQMVSQAAPGRRITTSTDLKDLADVRYAVVWKPTPGVLARAPKLQVIFNLGAGVDAILADETIPKSIPIVRIVDSNLTGRMSEWIALQVLLHHRQTLLYLRQQKEHLWKDVLDQPAASKMTVGVMGLGVLGQDSVKILRALRFTVIGWSRSPKTIEGIETFSGKSGLDGFLGRTDILVCLLPLTAETRGFLAMPLFRKLKRSGPLGGPFLINAGRGGEQIEADILAALNDGTLKGASLDVFETEPLPASSPLWSHPNCIVTPHNSADSEPKALTEYVLDQIANHEAGRPLRNVVSRDRGY